MTSVRRRFAQIEPRIAFFIALDDVSGYTVKTNFPPPSPIMTVVDFTAAFDVSASEFHVTFPTGYLLKDLGRQITVYDPTIVGSPHIALFRQVMQVSGPLGNEGVSTKIAYICTWEDGSGAYQVAAVARTG